RAFVNFPSLAALTVPLYEVCVTFPVVLSSCSGFFPPFATFRPSALYPSETSDGQSPPPPRPSPALSGAFRRCAVDGRTDGQRVRVLPSARLFGMGPGRVGGVRGHRRGTTRPPTRGPPERCPPRSGRR